LCWALFEAQFIGDGVGARFVTQLPRVLELEVISKQFGPILPSGLAEKLVEDMKLLKAETEPKIGEVAPEICTGR
jgi:hypothetical protein